MNIHALFSFLLKHSLSQTVVDTLVQKGKGIKQQKKDLILHLIELRISWLTQISEGLLFKRQVLTCKCLAHYHTPSSVSEKQKEQL